MDEVKQLEANVRWAEAQQPELPTRLEAANKKPMDSKPLRARARSLANRVKQVYDNSDQARKSRERVREAVDAARAYLAESDKPAWKLEAEQVTFESQLGAPRSHPRRGPRSNANAAEALVGGRSTAVDQLAQMVRKASEGVEGAAIAEQENEEAARRGLRRRAPWHRGHHAAARGAGPKDCRSQWDRVGGKGG